MKILIIEDDKQTAKTIKDEMKDYYAVDLAYTGEDGEYQAQVNNYDAIILDLMLPDIDGISICKKIREFGIKTPILALTGRTKVRDKVSALDSGIDDYLTKPFSFAELLARVRALMRRSPEVFSSNLLSVGNLSLDVISKTVKRKRVKIFLRRKEFDLLEFLMRNQRRVMTRFMILEHVWDSSVDPVTNTIDVHIKTLRDRIDKPFAKKLIKTVHGFGYKIEA